MPLLPIIVGPPGPLPPPVTVCSPWIEVDSPHLCCAEDDFAAGVLEVKILEASHLLYRASGRQFPGICDGYTRPCLGCEDGQFLAYAAGGSRQITGCGCDLSDGSGGIGCSAIGIALPGRPVHSVEEVKVDGAVVNAAAYRLADGYVLMRTDGAGWPSHQQLGLADTAESTFSVAYTYGNVPDPAGLGAVAALACEMAAACTPDAECRLPERLQSLTREGLTMTILDPFQFLDQARFGLREVDQWLAVVNPKSLDRAGKWFSTATIGGLHS